MAKTKKKTSLVVVETRPTVKKLLRCATVNGAAISKKPRGRPRKLHPLRKLSNDVVQDIMSRLSLRDTIRASSALSGWKCMWTAHPNLILNNGTVFSCWDKMRGVPAWDNHDENRDKFIACVDNVLQRHSGNGVNQFEINFGLNKEHAQHLDRWVGFAASAQAREIVFNLSPRKRRKHWHNDYSFPCHLFNDQKNGCHVKSLKLVCLSLELAPAFSGFANLKTLVLCCVPLDLGNLEYLLSKCCLLESLSIIDSPDLVNLSISHPLCRLQYLRVEDTRGVLQNVEFHVMNLTQFIYRGDTIPILLAGSSKQIEADITTVRFDDTLDYVLSELPNVLPHVSSLFVRFIMEAEALEMTNHCGKFRRLKHLKLAINIGNATDAVGVIRLASLFEVAPFVEKLEMEIVSSDMLSTTPEIDDSSIPTHPQNHLKTVCMNGFSCFKGEIQLAIFILRNATALEKMVIDPRMAHYYRNPTADEIARCHSMAHECIFPRDLRKVLTFIS